MVIIDIILSVAACVYGVNFVIDAIKKRDVKDGVKAIVLFAALVIFIVYIF